MLNRNLRVKTDIRLIAQLSRQILFILLFTMSFAVSALCQGYQVTYSDEWPNELGENSVEIVGAGVTQTNYTSFGHTYGVEVRLTAPNNATTTTMSSWSSSYAVGQSVVIWNGLFGNWILTTNHWTWNWYQNFTYISNTTYYNGTVTDPYDLPYYFFYGDPQRIVQDKCHYSLCSGQGGNCYYRTRNTLPIDYDESNGDCPVGFDEKYERYSILGVPTCWRTGQGFNDDGCY